MNSYGHVHNHPFYINEKGCKYATYEYYNFATFAVYTRDSLSSKISYFKGRIRPHFKLKSKNGYTHFQRAKSPFRRRRGYVINSNVLLHTRRRLKIAFSTISDGRKEEGCGGVWNKGNPDAETSIVVLNGERWARKRQCNEASEPERHNALSSTICFILKFMYADSFCTCRIECVQDWFKKCIRVRFYRWVLKKIRCGYWIWIVVYFIMLWFEMIIVWKWMDRIYIIETIENFKLLYNQITNIPKRLT